MSVVFYSLVGHMAYNGYKGFTDCELIIDNGGPAITVTVNGTDHVVSASSMATVKIPVGKVTIAWDGKTQTQEVKMGQYILNPGQKNAYRIVTTKYAIGGGSSFEEGTADEDLGSPEFFRVTTDFLFSTPSTVSSSNGLGGETRTTLEHKGQW